MLEKLSKEEFINNDDGLQRFCNINLEVLNQHAPQNKKYVRDNQMLFMRKQLSKKLMKRSRICNSFLRNRAEDNRIISDRQRNCCLSLLQKFKKEFYKSLCDMNLKVQLCKLKKQ